jgi:hypothetical protein
MKDLSSVSSACGFTNAAYNQATASSLAAKVTVTATKPGSNQVVTLNPSVVSATGTGGAVTTTSSKAAAATGGMKGGKAGLVGTALEVALAMMLVC